MYGLILLHCFFPLREKIAKLLLIKSKIINLFQALNFQTAVVSPGSILPPSVVDAIVEVFCYFSSAKSRN